MIEILVIFFVCILYIRWTEVTKNKVKLPPGPLLKLPVVGHIPFLGANPHVTLMHWSSRYGPLISLQLGSFPVVVINDGKILKAAFSSPVIAGRPKIRVLDDWSRRKGIGLCDGPHAREQRCFAQKILKDVTRTSESMQKRILDETADLIARLDAHKGKPILVRQFFNRNVVNSLLSVLISKKFEDGDPEMNELAHMLTSAFSNTGLLATLGTYIPSLCSIFPNAVGHSLWVKSGESITEFFRPIIQDHLRTHIPGQPRDILDIFLEKTNASRDDHSSSFHDGSHIEDTFRDILTGGMETTSSQLEWLIHFMAKYPKVQGKLIAEIDSVLPKDRRPSISNDRPMLPYTQAVIHELLRISTISPFGLLHSALEDTEIAGYKIPKDTVIIGNQYAVNNDPNVWDGPREFRPERFLDKDGKFAVGDKPVIAFGTGQRHCIGEGLARNQLFLFAVRIFQNFTVKAVGELPDDHKLAVTVSPRPFKVIFERRKPTAFH